MRKKIVIENCGECPTSRVAWNEDKQGYIDHYCRKMKATITTFPEIPNWCPLPDD